ncbi:NAD-dependent epimerase/dehydratase family protein, partial [Mariprofundus ferrooxydans]|nr:NAD-dependent epimerase/dehydratase family protein [Mariprofundus ferrooxydans]
IDGDIRDREAVRKAMQGVSKVVHLAALVSVPESIAQPNLCFDINAHGTQVVLDEARRSGVRKVVLASSAAVYGDNSNLPLSENEPAAPLSPYGLDKLYAEQLGRVYQSLYGMKVTALRFFNVFGPRQDPSSPYSGVISIFLERMLAGEDVNIFGDGSQTRDFVYVKDVVSAIMLSMQSDHAAFQVFNVGCGGQVSVNALYRTLCELVKPGHAVLYKPLRGADIVHSEADITAISTALAYKPEFSFEQGLKETLEWQQAG